MKHPDNILFVQVTKNDEIKYNYAVRDYILYPLASASKSIKSLILANALKSHLINSIDDKIGKYLQKIPAEFSQVTIKSLLTMSSGIQWPQGNVVMKEDNDVISWLIKNDIHLLDNQSFSYKPDSAIILKLLEYIYGRDISSIYRSLFSNYQINKINWNSNFSNYTGVMINPNDLKILGKLIYEAFNGDDSIFDVNFIKQLFEKQIDGGFPENTAYSYFWWLNMGAEINGIYAAGFGGQYWYISKRSFFNIIILSNMDRPHIENKQYLYNLIEQYE